MTPYSPTANTWYFVVLVYSGTNVTLSLDGFKVNTMVFDGAAEPVPLTLAAPTLGAYQ